MAKAGELLEESVEDLSAFKKYELTSHQALYKVIREGDPQKSRQAMIDHICYSENSIVDAFTAAEGVEAVVPELAEAL
jgi:DNA-binding FadR family transcriptional regulator